MRMNPPKFEGTLNLNHYLEWIQTLESFFDVKEYLDYKAFKMATFKLKKYALIWYENTKRQRAKEGRPQIKTWSKLRKLMYKRFLSDLYKNELYLRISSLNQD